MVTVPFEGSFAGAAFVATAVCMLDGVLKGPFAGAALVAVSAFCVLDGMSEGGPFAGAAFVAIAVCTLNAPCRGLGASRLTLDHGAAGRDIWYGIDIAIGA